MNKEEIQIKFDEIEKILWCDDTDKVDEQTREKLLHDIDSIIYSDPLNDKAYYYKGAFYQFFLKDYNTALECYEKVVEINPNGDCAKTTKSFIDDLREIKSIIDGYTPPVSREKIPQYSFLEKIHPYAILAIKIIIFVVCFYTWCPTLVMSPTDKKIANTVTQNTLQKQTPQKAKAIDKVIKPNSSNSNFRFLTVNPTTSLNYLTKKQIYDLRKKYVQASLFARKNYEPNERVFGSIVDGKPWWGKNPCIPLNYTGNNHERIQGNSKVSALINNPNTLVGISMAYAPWERDYNKEFCYGKTSDFLPETLQYNKDENLIVATYNVPSEFPFYKVHINEKEAGYPLQLSGLNALDFGYNYVYAFGTKNINMLYPENNITKEVNAFSDYIHLGGSCKYKDGCNNISPMQSDKIFVVKSLPAEINLKLWNTKPINQLSKADFYYKIIIKD